MQIKKKKQKYWPKANEDILEFNNNKEYEDYPTPRSPILPFLPYT